MPLRFAVSLLLTSFVSGIGAIVTVVGSWSGRLATPDTISPAMWAARSYLAHFDLWALATFLPSLLFCRLILSASAFTPAPQAPAPRP